jgi:hypothetical protein
VQNAICGFWGGYSSGTLIRGNNFDGNGGMAYGLERGAINMEHAAHNWISRNTFLNNRCAVHLWWDDDGALARYPGVAAQPLAVSGNVIARNRVVIDQRQPFGALRQTERLVVLQLRDPGRARVRSNHYFGNALQLRHPAAVEFDLSPGTQPARERVAGREPRPRRGAVYGSHRPVGARPLLRGRHRIVLDEWGPWDHERPMARKAAGTAGGHAFEVFGLQAPLRCEVVKGSVSVQVHPTLQNGPARLSVSGSTGITPYRIRLHAGTFVYELDGTIVVARWRLRFFPWTIDPRTSYAAWRALADGPSACAAESGALDFPYGWRGPRDLGIAPSLSRSDLGPDRFGMIAQTRVRLPAGRWRVVTHSDDGARVTIDGQRVIDNWTWHGPTRDEGFFTQEATGDVGIEVEHFEIDGYAQLKVEFEPAS